MIEQIGRYRVIRPIGSGGMGHVYLAEDPTLERRVAIKLLIRDPNHTGLGEEAKTLAALHHSGIVTIHEIGVHEGRDFIVMEYLQGKTLRELMMRGTTPRLVFLEICARVADALAAAHRAGVLHRDIKPENILIADDGTVKVLDFGIAHRLQRPVEAIKVTATDLAAAFEVATIVDGVPTLATDGTKTPFGTPAYMAPEVLQGEPSTTHSDVYSLGITVYECIAGKRPYEPRSLTELIALTIDAPPPALADPLGELIASMLSHDPEARPALIEVAEALDIKHTLPSGGAAPVARPSRRRIVIGGALAAAVAIGTISFVATRSSITPVPQPPPETPEISLEVADVQIPARLFEVNTPSSDVLSEMLTSAFSRTKGLRVDARRSARGVGHTTDYTLTVTISERVPDHRKAAIHLTRSGTPTFDHAIETPKSVHYGELIDAIGRAVVVHLDAHATLERRVDAKSAHEIYKRGLEELDKAEFENTRTYLEEATYQDPKSFEAWYSLSFVLGWLNSDDVGEAAKRALALAAPGSFEAKLMAGVVKFEDGDNVGTRDVLTPVEHDVARALAADPKNPTRIRDYRETLYYLGEAWWHDGHFAEGYKLFERVAKVDINFRPAAIHMRDYALAHHDLMSGAQILGLSSPDKDALLLSAGKYTELLKPGVAEEQRLAALLVLNRPIPVDTLVRLWGKNSNDYDLYWIAFALRGGDVASARRQFADAWQRHFTGEIPPNFVYSLGQYAEVLLVAELGPELRRVLALYQRSTHAQSRHDYHRIASLAAALLHDSTLLPAEKPSYRNEQIASAARAELAGDRKKAVELMTAVVKDPSRSMDFPERAMLLRNLRALRKAKDAAQLCRDTLRPFIYRNALLPFQRTCK